MANNNRIGGLLTFTIDGTPYNVRGNFDVNPSTVKREQVVGQDGVHGYTEMPVGPSIKCDLTTMPGLSLRDLEQNITGSTIQVTLANDKTYVLSQAWVTSNFTISAAEGRFGCEFQGMSLSEI